MIPQSNMWRGLLGAIVFVLAASVPLHVTADTRVVNTSALAARISFLIDSANTPYRDVSDVLCPITSKEAMDKLIQVPTTNFRASRANALNGYVAFSFVKVLSFFLIVYLNVSLGPSGSPCVAQMYLSSP